MTGTLDYAQPGSPVHSKGLRRVALASLFLPLVVVGLLYGEWLLARWSLGRVPRATLDDPRFITGARWVHGIAGLALFGVMHVALVALLINGVEIGVNRPSSARAVVRLSVFVTSWAALFVLLRWDPGAVFYWWYH